MAKDQGVKPQFNAAPQPVTANTNDYTKTLAPRAKTPGQIIIGLNTTGGRVSNCQNT